VLTVESIATLVELGRLDEASAAAEEGLEAAGDAERAVAELLRAFGGPELSRVLPVDRPAAAADPVHGFLQGGEGLAGLGKGEGSGRLRLERPGDGGGKAEHDQGLRLHAHFSLLPGDTWTRSG